jgi:ribosomal-protein-alanine N-acetyltransferase
VDFIRPAKPRDVERLMELEQVFDNAMSEKMLLRELEVGRGYVYNRITDDGDVLTLGYALVRQDGMLLDLTRLAVDGHTQSQGIGQSLLRRVLSEERETVLTVKKDNVRALALYKKNGFRVVGHYPAADAWVMRRAAPSSPRPDHG